MTKDSSLLITEKNSAPVADVLAWGPIANQFKFSAIKVRGDIMTISFTLPL